MIIAVFPPKINSFWAFRTAIAKFFIDLKKMEANRFLFLQA